MRLCDLCIVCCFLPLLSRHCMSFVLYCFFFKQKTAYEMRISDWSSDVCSSDLDVGAHPVAGAKRFPRQAFVAPHQRLCTPEIDGHVAELVALDDAVHHLADAVLVFVVLSLALGFAHQIGRAHVRNPVTNAHIVCRLLLAQKKINISPPHTL